MTPSTTLSGAAGHATATGDPDSFAVFKEGIRAADAGLPAAACPYPQRTKDRRDWNGGHRWGMWINEADAELDEHLKDPPCSP